MQKKKGPSENLNRGSIFLGIASLVFATISACSLAAFYLITVLDIPPETFFKYNRLFAGIYCIVTPLAFFLGVLGLIKERRSKILCLSGLCIAGGPFLVLLWQFITFLRQ